MIRSTILLSAFGLTLSGSLLAQATPRMNYKFFFNERQVSAVTRYSSAAGDTLYQMPPLGHLRTVSKITGWEAVLQDENYGTPETVQFGIVAFQKDGKTPDTTAKGLIHNGVVKLSFPKPTTGTRSATVWEITPGQIITTAGERHGVRLVLSSAATATDGCQVFTQFGRDLKLPNGVKAENWAFALSSAGTAVPFFASGGTPMHKPGTTLYVSPSYHSPVIRNYCNSTAYGKAEDLFGPESLTPGSKRGDKVGWEVYSDVHPNAVAVLMIGSGLAPKPLDVPKWGRLWMLQPFGFLNVTLVLDKYGVGKSLPLAAPSGLKLFAQAAFVDMKAFSIELSDLVEMETK
ncbi:MAG: hypothetical protein CSA62_03245 [Planctomycetota bacterium]|nr:MAG: hypothetical protein CSA62_03245 [Planctomycetota bacterium]